MTTIVKENLINIPNKYEIKNKTNSLHRSSFTLLGFYDVYIGKQLPTYAEISQTSEDIKHTRGEVSNLTNSVLSWEYICWTFYTVVIKGVKLLLITDWMMIF